MRVIGDQFADIDTKTGERLHTKVRVLRDDAGRVAVFLSPSVGPAEVYNLDDVVVTRRSANCSHPVCHGKATRMKLARLWETSEAAHAV
jgi:hypothetical protein